MLVPKKPPEQTEVIDDIMEATGLERGVVEGVLGDLSIQHVSKRSQNWIAQRWGLPFGNISTIRNMGKVTIDEMRSTIVTKNLIIGNEAKDLLMDKMNDPMWREKLDPKTLATISKTMDDGALNMSNNAVGTPQTQVNIGDLKILIQNRDGREQKTALERLADRGVKAATLAVEVAGECDITDAIVVEAKEAFTMEDF